MTRWLVVGGGAAGCVVASRLSDDASNDVVLVEAGPEHEAPAAHLDHGPYVTDPARLLPASSVVRARGRAPVEYLQGFGLGGSSLVNMGIADLGSADADVEHLMPLEAPWRVGALGAAVLAEAPAAREVLLTRRDGRRVTVAEAYLSPVRDRPNLAVHVNRAVERIVIERGRAVGVVTGDGAHWEADRVVCCAGTIHTAGLLLRSGVGAPGVGDGIQDHPAVAITLELDAEFVTPTSAAIGVSIAGNGRQIMVVDHLPQAAHLGALMPGLMRVRSRGRVTVPDRSAPPIVELGQLTDPSDLDLLVGCVAEALALLDRPAVQAVVAGAYLDEYGTPASTITGDVDLIRTWVSSHVGGYHHITSSCREGVSANRHGEVVGLGGLYVGDASLFPGVPEANPFMPVIIQAERLVAHWRASV